MSDQESQSKPEDGKDEISLSELLVKKPPGTIWAVADLTRQVKDYSSYHLEIANPQVMLYCSNEKCRGPRMHVTVAPEYSPALKKGTGHVFLEAVCKNCDTITKTYAIILEVDKHDSKKGLALKVGDHPAFGDRISPRFLRLLKKEDRELFLKGRRAGRFGLGIGALTYYRRVVENHKDRLLSEVLEVAKITNAPKEVIAAIQGAKRQTQFESAIESLKGIVPKALLIQGQNPLALLHAALSRGIHGLTDEECLEIATSMKEVLAAMSDRVSELLRDRSNLKEAVSKLNRIVEKGKKRS